MAWEKEVKNESKTKRKLIKEALESANAVQLLAVREYLKRYNAVYGYDSINWVKTAAEKAFDEGKYDDPHISYLVNEGELAQILQQPGVAIEICKKVVKSSLS